MRLCVGTAKGIVLLDSERGGTPLLALADPASVWCMAQDCTQPEIIYAGSIHNLQAGSARGKSSLARSSDGGRNWHDITPRNARDEEVWAVAAAPDVTGQIFVGTSHARLFRSDDGGYSFHECTSFLKIPGRERWGFAQSPHVAHVRSIALDPAQPDIIYVGVEGGGVFRSNDRGGSFEPANYNIYPDVHCVLVDPNDSRRIYATTGRGLYVSCDSGRSWRLAKGLSRGYAIPLAVRHTRPAVVYTAAAAGPPPTWPLGAAGADAHVFCSDDGGENFRALPVDGAFSHTSRGMVMRIRDDHSDALLGALSDGGLIRIERNQRTLIRIGEKLPPTYDFVTLPGP
jgi:photosystem II stability/assembly factor-like uncharacterized protein